MEKIELKHLAPYLPYGLNIKGKKHREKYQEIPIYKLNGLATQSCGGVQYEFENKNELFFAMANDKNWKPILRPLSDLKNDEVFTELYNLIGGGYKTYESFKNVNLKNFIHGSTSAMSYRVIELFLSLHIDVFGLIEKDLAIDINTIKL